MLVIIFITAGLLLRSLIFLRGYQSRMLRTYAWFYSYMLSVLAADATLYFVWLAHPNDYLRTYWLVQFATLAFGSGVILEIFRHVLAAYPGAERFARAVCLITFAIIFVSGLFYPRATPSGMQAASIELERDVRAAQIVFFIAIMAVIFYYGIPLGKNMRGMMSGYGLYLGTSLATLAVRAYVGREFDSVWRVVQPLSLDISLLIWLFALWGYHPNPVPVRDIRLESDYEALATLTRIRINALRSYLGRSVR
jgi:hypothetical protein